MVTIQYKFYRQLHAGVFQAEPDKGPLRCFDTVFFGAINNIFNQLFNSPPLKMMSARTAQSQSSMFASLTRWNANRSYSLQTAYLMFEAHLKFFFQQFP